jgi:hypothetical protein
MAYWERFKQLTFTEMRLILSAFFLLPFLNFLLRVIGYTRLYHLIESLTPIAEELPMTSRSLQISKSIAHAVNIGANHGVYRATCLRRSLLVFWYLRSFNMACKIRFGVRLVNGDLEAHAWVEWQDIVINDERDVIERFSVLENGLPKTQLGL